MTEKKQSGLSNAKARLAALSAGIAEETTKRAKSVLGYDAGFEAGLSEGRKTADYESGFQAGLAQGRAEADETRAKLSNFADEIIAKAHALKESLAEGDN